MHIAQFSDVYDEIAGVCQVVKFFERETPKRKHPNSVFATKSRNRANILELPFLFQKDYTFVVPDVFKMSRLCRKLGVDVLHAHTPFSMGLSSLYVKRDLGIPAVGTFHTVVPEYSKGYVPVVGGSSWFKEFLWAYLRRVYGGFDAVTTPSFSTRDMLATHGIHAEVIPNGIDVDRFNPDVDPAPFLDAYGLEPGYLLSLGRVEKEKNLDLAFDMMKGVKDLFVVAGKGKEFDRLKSIAPSNVKMLGFLADELLPAAYQGARAFIMCSTTDTHSLASLEALASGIPVIAYDCPNNRETHKDAAVYFSDAGEFKECVHKVHERAAWAKLSRKARKVALDNSPDRMINRFLKLYQDLIDQNA